MVSKKDTKFIVLIGAHGMLAQMVAEMTPQQWRVIPLDLPEFDLTDASLVQRVIGELRPDVIINCAAYTQVDACETNEELANKVNGEGPGYLATAAKEVGATLVHISTDYVFDGLKTSPYSEDDRPNPPSAYGRSKLLGEEAIQRSGLQEYFIIRTSWLYGPGGKNFVETIARLAAEHQELRIVADQIGSPTYTGDLAAAIFHLLKVATPPPSRLPPHAPYGLYHFANEGECSWHEFALAIVDQLKGRGEAVMAKEVLPIRTEEYPLPAPRPTYSVFSKDKYRRATGAIVPHWKESLVRYFDRRTQAP